jgi:microcystin-dependent protein
MSAPFVGEIRILGCNFAPRGWAFCAGQLMAISQNPALFALLGIYYGGNGTTNFALPDLRGRAPMFFGQGPGLTPRSIGEQGGSEAVGLVVSEMPSHTHVVSAATSHADRANASGAVLASGSEPVYGPGPATVAMAGSATTPEGGSQPHNNMQPFVALNFCIALQGIFPPR